MAFATESGRVLKYKGEYPVLYEELLEGEWIVPTRAISFDETWYSHVISDAELEVVIRSQTEKKPLSEYYNGNPPRWAKWLDEMKNYSRKKQAKMNYIQNARDKKESHWGALGKLGGKLSRKVNGRNEE